MKEENPLKVVLWVLVAGTLIYIFCDIISNTGMCDIQGKTSARCILFGDGIGTH